MRFEKDCLKIQIEIWKAEVTIYLQYTLTAIQSIIYIIYLPEIFLFCQPILFALRASIPVKLKKRYNNTLANVEYFVAASLKTI